MATPTTCNNIFARSWGMFGNQWFAYAITDNGVTKDQWNAASPAQRTRWLQISYDARVGKCGSIPTAGQKLLLKQTALMRATRTYPTNPLGAVVKAVGGAVSKVAATIGGPIGGLVSSGLQKALGTGDDTPRPMYQPLTTGSAGPPNPNATTGTPTIGGLNPLLLIGGVVIVGVVLLYAIKKGAN
jgi:hypothetical protein